MGVSRAISEIYGDFRRKMKIFDALVINALLRGLPLESNALLVDICNMSTISNQVFTLFKKIRIKNVMN